MRRSPEWFAEYERGRVTRIGNAQIAATWNGSNCEPVRLGDIGHAEATLFVDAVGGPNCKASVAVSKRAPVTSLPAPESAVLRAVLEALRLHPRVAWAVRMNSGRFEVEGRWITASFKGCADILGQLKTGELLACECKSAAGKTTEDQAAFLKTVADNGGVAFVARSVDDVMRALAAPLEAA